MKTKDNLHPLMREIIAPWAPLTYADHYYVDLGYRHERGKVSEHEYRMALAEGPEARRLMNRGAMEAMQRAY
jgi:hypothetical protein